MDVFAFGHPCMGSEAVSTALRRRATLTCVEPAREFRPLYLHDEREHHWATAKFLIGEVGERILDATL